MLRSDVTSAPETGAVRLAGRKLLKHGSWLPVLRPGQTGSNLPEKGLHTATGAAGEGCNEKSSLHYSR
ncbi:hypothetical protein [Escherichia coli]|uniref:hypothetical protein n=1 Tax=Escherichia coli TaxID=562 RepID=UPI0020014F0A|nr:hypothetical protein [Escherichia coli]